MIICTSAFQELPLDKEGMVLRKFGITVLLFWRERERDVAKENGFNERHQPKKQTQMDAAPDRAHIAT